MNKKSSVDNPEFVEKAKEKIKNRESSGKRAKEKLQKTIDFLERHNISLDWIDCDEYGRVFPKCSDKTTGRKVEISIGDVDVDVCVPTPRASLAFDDIIESEREQKKAPQHEFTIYITEVLGEWTDDDDKNKEFWMDNCSVADQTLAIQRMISGIDKNFIKNIKRFQG